MICGLLKIAFKTCRRALLPTAPIVLLQLLSSAAVAQDISDRDPMAPISTSGQPAASEAAEEDSDAEPVQDPSVKLKIEPLSPANLVDRVCEPARLSVKCPGAIDAAFYLVPVDAPYGGKPVGKTRLIGKARGSKLSIMWSTVETNKYFKVFVVVHRSNDPLKAWRSSTVDVAMSGSRYRPGAPPPLPRP
jgi:hypothetical protein